MITATGHLEAELCDAHANGSTAAIVRIHAKAGAFTLCGHHYRKYEATFVAAEYDVEVLDEAMMIRPMSVQHA